MRRSASLSLYSMLLGLLLVAPPAHSQDSGPVMDAETDDDAPPGLAKSVVAATIRENLPAIRLCYQRALAVRSTLHGEVFVTFVIVADGTVSSAEVSSSTLDHPDMEACVCKRIKRLRFPEPAGGGTVVVNHPFVFRTDRAATHQTSTPTEDGPLHRRKGKRAADE